MGGIKGKSQLSKEAVKKRREESFQMILKGVSYQQIAKSYGISKKQVEKDLLVIRREKAKQLKKIDLNERVAEYDESARQRLARIWGILSDQTSKKREIIDALKLLQHEEELRIRRDQIAGVIPRENVTNINFNKFDITTADSININFEDLEYPQIESNTEKEENKIIDVESEENNED